jgi:DNA-directed RNA polymerase subunit RPC12/RpoP
MRLEHMSNNEGPGHHEHPEHTGHTEGSKTCRVCSSSYDHEQHSSRFGICEKCGYKILILLVVVMVAISYVAWFGIL